MKSRYCFVDGGGTLIHASQQFLGQGLVCVRYGISKALVDDVARHIRADFEVLVSFESGAKSLHALSWQLNNVINDTRDASFKALHADQHSSQIYEPSFKRRTPEYRIGIEHPEFEGYIVVPPLEQGLPGMEVSVH